MEWQPIEAYDKLAPNLKPKLAVFWFAGTPPARGQLGKYGLNPTQNLSRIMGNRVCTHWVPLPDNPAEALNLQVSSENLPNPELISLGAVEKEWL